MKQYFLKPKSLTIKLTCAFLVLFAAFLINSCRKDILQSGGSVVTKTLADHHIDITAIQKAYINGTSLGKLKANDISSQAIANIINTLNVDWSTYTLQEFADSSKIIEFPMPDDTTLIAPQDSIQMGQNKYKSKTSAVFILHKDTIILNFFMKTVEDLNDPSYQSTISQQFYLNTPTNFNGEIMYFTLDKQFINGYLWKGGSISKAISIGAGPIQPTPKTQTYKRKLKTDALQLSNCISTVYEVVTITTVTTPDGITESRYEPTGQTLTITTCDVTDTGSGGSSPSGGVSGGTGSTPAPPLCVVGSSSGAAVSSVKGGRLIINVNAPPTGGSGGTTSSPAPVPCPPVPPPATPPPAVTSVNDIKDSVTNACLKALISRLTSDQTIQTDVTNILRNTFGATDQINITFDQSILTGSNSTIDAITGGQNDDFTVTFNTPLIAPASQEFMLETTMHEIFHAYLYANPSIRQGFSSQHSYMIQNYVNTEVATLQKVFPNLSLHDAQCLVLGGYGTVDPTTLNTALAAYGLTLNDVAATNNKYAAGTAGTICQNP